MTASTGTAAPAIPSAKLVMLNEFTSPEMTKSCFTTLTMSATTSTSLASTPAASANCWASASVSTSSMEVTASSIVWRTAFAFDSTSDLVHVVSVSTSICLIGSSVPGGRVGLYASPSLATAEASFVSRSTPAMESSSNATESPSVWRRRRRVMPSPSESSGYSKSGLYSPSAVYMPA